MWCFRTALATLGLLITIWKSRLLQWCPFYALLILLVILPYLVWTNIRNIYFGMLNWLKWKIILELVNRKMWLWHPLWDGSTNHPTAHCSQITSLQTMHSTEPSIWTFSWRYLVTLLGNTCFKSVVFKQYWYAATNTTKSHHKITVLEPI